MLEGLAAWVLNTYVGEYVENLNTHQLSIGLLQGAVELENLPLKKDALRKLAMPIEVKTGFIGRIKLQIPVSRLKSEPWVISMDQLYLVAGPLREDAYSEEAEKKSQEDRKKAALTALEEKWKAETQIASQSSGGSWWGYGASLASLATNIVENIQLNVSNVHLRYEDDVSIPGHSYACGVTIHHLAAQSTDHTWLPKFVNRYNADMMHKLLDLQNFSIYWDVDTAMVGHLGREELAEALTRESMKCKSTGEFKVHEYILEPVSGQARMKRNTSALPLRSPHSPRLQFDVTLEKMAFSLSENQYRGMLALIKEFRRYDKARRYRKWKPDSSPKESPQSWWKFAIDANLHGIKDRNRRCQLSYVIQRARDAVTYVKAYSDYLQKGAYYMDTQLKTDMERIEDDWTFEELRGLRELVMENIKAEEKLKQELHEEFLSQETSSPPTPSESSVPEPQQEGIFQRWFPGWSGWYGGAAAADVPEGSSVDQTGLATPSTETSMSPPLSVTSSPPSSPVGSPGGTPPASPGPTTRDTQIEKEILDVIADSAENNTLLKRDTVFAQLNFCLQSGMFKLFSSVVSTGVTEKAKGVAQRASLMELECSTIKMNFESRPRSSGLKFGVSVGGLFLRDKMTTDSIMPVLIAPQAKERVSSQPRQLGSMLGGAAKGPVMQQALGLGQQALAKDQTLFELLYEKKPAHSNADYRLDIKTQPLDIVYNAQAIKRVSEFFRVGKGSSVSAKAELELAAAAKKRYEQLKRQTTLELRHTLDDLLEGDSQMKSKRWDFALDISAPQFIIPENFQDQNSTMVLFDLGRLKLHNLNAAAAADSTDVNPQEEDDEFVTPTSTPPSEQENSGQMAADQNGADVFSENLSDTALHDKIYDKYQLQLSELQVMVGRARDNWKHAHNKGTSLLHVVDKFSISLQLERRLLFTTDPQWPKTTISGTLPSLVLHVNEQKVQALHMVSSQLSAGPPVQRPSQPTRSVTPDPDKLHNHSNEGGAPKSREAAAAEMRQSMANAKLLLMQFAITQVSLEMQSRGRSIAELQVRGVRAHFTKQPYNSSLSFTVHSLLVVDALQTFGPDFELLVASHGNLCLDSQSGSIRGSDPNSPRSPQSPLSPSSPTAELEQSASAGSLSTIQSAVNSALNSFINSTTGSQSEPHLSRSFHGVQSPVDCSQGWYTSSAATDSEALIRVELDLISPACPSNTTQDEQLCIANVQFNNLDIVANQQTIVELLNFFKQLSPSQKPASRTTQPMAAAPGAPSPAQTQGASMRMEVTAEFHRLNLLLMRAEEVEYGFIGKKVATATLSKAKIQATHAGTLNVEGSLDGMQLLDLTPEGRRHHQKVFSLGIEPDMLMCDGDFHPHHTTSVLNEGPEKAFQLTFVRPSPLEEAAYMQAGRYSSPTPHEPVTVNIRMASLCYTHSPTFLRDLSLSLTEFKAYMTGVGSSLKYAAQEVAMGLVHKRSEFLSQSLYGSNLSLDGGRKRMSSLGPGEAEDNPLDVTAEGETVAPLAMCLDVVLQTPVVVIPRKPGSREVLIAQLGHISLQNSQAHHMASAAHIFQPIQPDNPSERLHVEIREMSLYTMNLSRSKTASQFLEGSMYKSCFTSLQPGTSSQSVYGNPILHHTAIQLTVEKCGPDENFINQDTSMEIPFAADINKTKETRGVNMESVLKIRGKVVSPFRLELSKGAYEQILQTLDHLTPSDDGPVAGTAASLSEIKEEVESPGQSTSMLKLEEMSQTVPMDRLRDLTELSERPSSKQAAAMAVEAQFQLPSFNVRMLGEFTDDRGIVELRLSDFKVNYTKSNPHVAQVEVSLQSLVLEDLHCPDPSHRYLMVSNISSTAPNSTGTDVPLYLSASCPTSMITVPLPQMPPSLPSSFHRENVFEYRTRSTSGTKLSPHKRRTKSTTDCPCTPPPSPEQSPIRSRRGSAEVTGEENFINIKVKLVDKKCPEFAKKYNRTNRFIDAAFSGLDTSVNLQTWVLVLDFLGLGAKVHDLNQYTRSATQARLKAQHSVNMNLTKGGEPTNSDIKLHIQRLTLTLNKAEYELAHAEISGVTADMRMRDNNLSVLGHLGSLALLDTSPHGKLFRERFITTGSQALDFDIFKYGTPDPDLQREEDVSVKLTMSSVRYIHTHRFMQELLAFIQHFNQLQDVLGRSRAASAGHKISDTAFRGSRVSLDIQAGAPILIFPHSSRSTDTIVMNLGTLTVSNQFLHAGKEGTIGFQRDRSASFCPDTSASVGSPLTASQASGLPDDCMAAMSQSVYGSLSEDWRGEDLSPTDPDLLGHGLPQSSHSDSHLYNKPHMPESVSSPNLSGTFDPSNHQCLLDVMQVALLDMDLFSGTWTSKEDYVATGQQQDLVFPSYVIVRQEGRMLKERCRLNLQVERNLEGDRSHAVPDLRVQGALSSVHCWLECEQYRLLRGFLEHNLGEPLEDFQRPHMLTHLQEPTIQTVLSGEVWKSISICVDLNNFTLELLNSRDSQGLPLASMAKFDFNKSRLVFESFSDQSKDIDLVSHEIVAQDTRYQDAPVNTRPNVFPNILRASRDCTRPDALQMELHYRSSRDATRVTALLNNMRLMGVFDWFLAVKDYLGSSAENPWLQALSVQEASPVHDSNVSACSVPSGVLTKRVPSVEEVKPPLEVKLNVTDTEFVVVENAATWDTNAVILKSTAVLSYRPSMKERVMSCSLQSLEVFSCSLAAEDETALSIIDPMTITVELNHSSLPQQRMTAPAGLMDAYGEEDRAAILEVSFSVLNLRLSYNDLKLFLAIFNSLPLQAQKVLPKNHSQASLSPGGSPEPSLSGPSPGASPGISLETLTNKGMALDSPTASAMGKDSTLLITAFEVKAGSICFCLIDDCQDADVPLGELTFSNVHLFQKWSEKRDGWASFRLAGDYYNYSLSGWEPFLESWGCHILWDLGAPDDNKMKVNIKANDVLNFNVTKVFLDQLKRTKKKWTDDYYSSPQHGQGNSTRRRVPFVPFSLRNETGSKLWFRTDTASPTRMLMSGGFSTQAEGNSLLGSQALDKDWLLVPQGEERQFLFEERDKIRHKHTHELKVHQVRVKIAELLGECQVSVDKVGLYFREADQACSNVAMLTSKEPPARIVFDVTLEGARKVLTVRSALMVYNKLEDPITIQLRHHKDQRLNSILRVPKQCHVAIPLTHVLSSIQAKPEGHSVDYCQPIYWQQVIKKGEARNSLRSCEPPFGGYAPYKFCVSVYHQHFPEEKVQASNTKAADFPRPGHVITLVPPVRVINLLPVELTYFFKNTSLRSTIKPGRTAAVIGADLKKDLELGVTLDNFPQCTEVIIPPATPDYDTLLALQDYSRRPLHLLVQIKEGIGGSLKLLISAPFWLVNKCGIPLVFRQDNAKQEMAGQLEDHEVGQSFMPLLFSYSDPESQRQVSLRVGRDPRLHGPQAKPVWCPPFSLERGIAFLQLHVRPHDQRPDWVYNLGIEVRQGRGRYDKTHIVTLSPRYHLDNRSRHKLAFSQQYYAKPEDIGSEKFLSVPSGGKLPFHWPRQDLDPLLCVCILGDVPSLWSGGFRIDRVDSFHVHIRCRAAHSQFLRVDIILQGATNFIVFSDADHMPPPYRIDNHSEVPLTYCQTKAKDSSPWTIIKPHMSVPYAFDEPTSEPHLTLSVQGGSKSTYNMDVIGEGAQLTYENFIYIAFTATFKGSSVPRGGQRTQKGYDSFMESQELVLDVLQNNRVVLKKKESGKRSQFWRMTGSGMLQHEGSSTPRAPGSSKSASYQDMYVLDIADLALRPGHDMPLMLRKPDERRKSTQTWRFTPDGRLCLGTGVTLASMCVQAKTGFFGLQDGGEVVLGGCPAIMRTPQDVPPEMAIQRQKMRPGSGLLSVEVVTDGPTRVLLIRDIKARQQPQQVSLQSPSTPPEDWVMINHSTANIDLQDGRPQQQRHMDCQVSMTGVGVSLVNHIPEELIYISLQHINITYNKDHQGVTFTGGVDNVQVDNQLFGAMVPTMLYMSPGRKDSPMTPELPMTTKHSPTNAALRINLRKTNISHSWNADIYENLIVKIRKFVLQIEEKLLWKLFEFAGYNERNLELEQLDENSFKSQRALPEAMAEQFKLKRYYFGRLELHTSRLMLSVITSSDLPKNLKVIKKSLGIPLVRFEEANVELDPFIKVHPFETNAFLIGCISQHYTDELKSQAAKILGSVDFLGNPLGLFNDVTEGLSGLLKDGNLGGLIKNVTHGVSNSAAKVTGSLSDGLSALTVDEDHEKARQDILTQHTRSSRGHLLAGMKGLGHGLFGGLTGVVTQPYSRFQQDGLEGLVPGFASGVIGIVTKPVAGVLDFASSTASAVRDKSRRSSHLAPPRVRPPRCCHGPGGLLPSYSFPHADAQKTLYSLNFNNYEEMFISIEHMRFGQKEGLKVLLSSQQVYFLGSTSYQDNIVLQTTYSELVDANIIQLEGKVYIELEMREDKESGGLASERRKRPRVRCDSETIARKVTQQILYAKNLYDEARQTLPPEGLLLED